MSNRAVRICRSRRLLSGVSLSASNTSPRSRCCRINRQLSIRKLSNLTPPPTPTNTTPPIAKSSNDSTPETARPNDNSEFIAEHHVDPARSVFPWRHSPLPLPRLVPTTDEYRAEGGYVGPGLPPLNRWVRGMMRWNAASMLNVPLWKIALFRGWEQELAGQFAWAFHTAVAGVLANTYRVPVEQTSKDSTAEGDEDEKESSFAVNFDQTVDPPPHPVDITEEKPAPPGDVNDEPCPEIEYMLQRQLRTLYEAAHEHTRHRLQIQLKMAPTSAEIVSLLLVPCLTRERVEATPALRHTYRKIWSHLEEREQELGRRLGLGEAVMDIGSQLEELARRQADSTGILESTVIAQVAIRCAEVFKVVDVELGEVVQGDPRGRVNDVVHLVRFEMVVRASIEGGPATLGSWVITDWDDLLGGNVWFI